MYLEKYGKVVAWTLLNQMTRSLFKLVKDKYYIHIFKNKIDGPSSPGLPYTMETCSKQKHNW